jgi:hypothetical protein
MNTKSKLMFAVAALAMSFSIPAYAQSTDHTGTLQPSYYDGTGKQHVGDWAPNSGATKLIMQTRPLYNSGANKPIVQTRPLYNSAVIPSEVRGGTSGYDPSIASQR